MEKTGEIVLADDSGLEVDALGGEPGIYSARYMGYDTSYHIKNNSLIERLEGKTGEERSARFVCAIAACFPDGRVLTKRRARMDLVMTRYSICRNISAILQNFHWKRRTN